MQILKEHAEMNPPLLGDMVKQVEQCLDRRLWADLGEVLLNILKQDALSGDKRVVYDELIGLIGVALAEEHLIELVLLVAEDHSRPNETIKFLRKQRELYQWKKESIILIDSCIVINLLLVGEVNQAAEILEWLETQIDSDQKVRVRRDYLKAETSYARVCGDYGKLFEKLIRYLELAQVGENVTIGYEVCLSGLIATDVWEFGEVVEHPVMKALHKTESGWIVEVVDLMEKGEKGSMGVYESMFKPRILKDKRFSQYEGIIKEKLQISVLRRMAQELSLSTRSLDFKRIAEECHSPPKEVEGLLIRAHSIGVLQCEIDEVSQMVHIAWIKPRAMNRNQIRSLQRNLDEWLSVVRESTQTASLHTESVAL